MKEMFGFGLNRKLSECGFLFRLEINFNDCKPSTNSEGNYQYVNTLASSLNIWSNLLSKSDPYQTFEMHIKSVLFFV